MHFRYFLTHTLVYLGQHQPYKVSVLISGNRLQSNKQIEKLQLQLSNESVEDLIHSTSNQLVNDKDENSETFSANKSFFSRIFKKQSN